MPPVRSARTRKPPPVGFSDIEDTLLEYANKMKDAENAPHEGKKRAETLWPIFQVAHQRSRYIYDLEDAVRVVAEEWVCRWAADSQVEEAGV
jgi:bud site selection protein 31